MANWQQNSIVLTTIGRTLLSDAQLGKGRIKITRVLARENFESTVSDLKDYTLSDIPDSSIAQTGHILSTQTAVEHPDPEQDAETSLITVRFSNDELEDETETYNLRQIIVMARLVDIETDENLPFAEDLGEVPYMVAQCASYNEPDLMPPREDNPTSLDYDIYIVHAGVPEITVDLRTDGYVFMEVYNIDKAEIWAAIDELEASTVGQSTDEMTFNTWVPLYNESRAWSYEDTGDTVTGSETSERFNNYEDSENIVTGNNSSAFGKTTEVLGNNSSAFGFRNFIGGSASNAFISGVANSVRSGDGNSVSGGSNDIVSGNANTVSGICHKLTNSNYNSVSGNFNTLDKTQNSLISGAYTEAYGVSSSILSGLNVSVGNSASPQWNESKASVVVGESISLRSVTESLVIGNDIESNSSLNYAVLIGNSISTESHLIAIGNTIIATGSCANAVVLGTQHEINSSPSSFIVGDSNTINSALSAATLGHNNTLNNADYSFMTGNQNTINAGVNTVVFGNSNTSNSSYNNIVGGLENEVTNSNNSIVVGSNHNVYGSVGSVIGGNANTVTTANNYVAVCGTNNRLSHTSNANVSGSSNVTDYANSSAITGTGNRIYGQNQNNSNIVGGDSNVLHNDGSLGRVSIGRSVIVGADNDVADYNNIALSGSNNTLDNITDSAVTGRYINVYHTNSQPRSFGAKNCIITGNNISVTQFESSIITGRNHLLSDYEPTGTAGEWNINSCYSIICGESNDINGIYSSVVSGTGNSVSNIHDSFIGGKNNTVNGDSTPSGGYTNCVLVLGYSNTVNSNSSDAMQTVFGSSNTVSSRNSLTSGDSLINSSDTSTVLGKYNEEDTEGLYAVIVGGGNSTERANIAALDWNGNFHINSVYLNSIYNADGTPFDFGGGSNYIAQGTGMYSLLLNDIEDNRASGEYATALGQANNVSGDKAVAMGSNNEVSSNNSVAIGLGNTVTGTSGGYNTENFVAGKSNRLLTSNSSAVFGYQQLAQNCENSFVVGKNNHVLNDKDGFTSGYTNSMHLSFQSAVLGGYDNSIIGSSSSGYTNYQYYSAIIGGTLNRIDIADSEDNGPQKGSIILGGQGLSVPTSNCVVMGTYNDPTGLSDAALIIGNGDGATTSNAVVIDTSGNIFCGSDSKSLNERIADLENSINTMEIYQSAVMPDDSYGMLTIGHVVSTGNNVVNIVGEVCVDTNAALPNANSFTGYVLQQGSIAYVINTGNLYVLDSNSAWHLKQ